jgi:alpha-tubulin suppressor-like RCC1 family protein
MRYTRTMSAALLLLFVVACDETEPPASPAPNPADMTQDMTPDMEPDMEPDLPPPDPCEGVDCGEHGTCAPSGDQPSCVCDTGYVPEGLGCALEPTAPVIENLPATQSGHAGEPGSLQLMGSDVNPGDVLSWSVTSTTCAFPVVVDDAGLVSWTCAAAAACEAVLSVSDGALMSAGTLSIGCANEPPVVADVAVTPDPIPSAGAALTCSYTFTDPDDDADQSTIEWLVDGQVAGSGQDFTAYGFSAAVACRVTPHDSFDAGAPVTSPDLIAPVPPDVAAGDVYSCAMYNGAAKCWGVGALGQLGDSTYTILSAVPVQVTGLTSGVTAISAGDAHTCVIHHGAAKCWGNGSQGQLGYASFDRNNFPVQVVGLTSDVTAISNGANHTCVIQNGAVKCWGEGSVGELGDGTNSSSNVPVQVVGLTSGVTAISASGGHTCVIQNGALSCWGLNQYGQLGDGTSTNSNVPVQVAGMLSGVTAVSAGSTHTCVIQNGAAKCWGRGDEGELGDGTNASSNSPVQVVGLTSGVTAIEGGRTYTCAIHNGAAKCWGRGVEGQLGQSLSINSNLPVQVTGLSSGVTAISAGINHTCAIHNSTIRCWGDGFYGQLGNGNSGAGVKSATPVPVTWP